ncbi:27211_t:CDS:2 [Dentiscutata erythropus]|uniref:27211_t:CDS:1 n=1 Tax=Dentiscutata erythropus TaxID=1348616 RepID=A0A9N9GNZ6_9GLOM|nr:27211_t:CDS:2 [Dentiscutata erythropus]
MKGRRDNLAKKIPPHNNMKGQHIYKAVPQSGFNFELLSNAKLNKDDLIKEVKKIIPNHYLKENCAESIKHRPERLEQELDDQYYSICFSVNLNDALKYNNKSFMIA